MKEKQFMANRELDYKEWFFSAQSDLDMAQVKLRGNITYYNLCFHLQQAVEKSLKSLLIFLNCDIVPKTHNIKLLLMQLERYGIILPSYLEGILPFTGYVSIRYHGEVHEILKGEYNESLILTKKCLEWVNTYLNEHNFVLT